jgi:hypothetical protein
MKKSELKSLIKECIKEVIFEEGVLTNIVTEVATGMRVSSTAGIVNESPMSQVTSQSNAQMKELARISNEASKMLDSNRGEVMKAIGKSAYTDLNEKFSDQGFFSGTKPLQESQGKGGALSGLPPGDAGLDITNIPGFQNWGLVSNKIESKK